VSDDQGQQQDRHQIHAALASTLHEQGQLLVSSVVITVSINDQGEKTLAVHTAPDQRTWETLGLLESVRLEYAAYITEQRVAPDSDS
jgi:hypothetical protein